MIMHLYLQLKFRPKLLSFFNFIPNPSKGCISQCTRSSMLCRLHTLRPTVRAVEYISITTGHKAWVIRLTYICHWSGQCSDQPPLPKHRQVYTGQHNVTFVSGVVGVYYYTTWPLALAAAHRGLSSWGQSYYSSLSPSSCWSNPHLPSHYH